MLKRFNLENAKYAKTPMSSTLKLSEDVNGKMVDNKVFKSMIGSLLYLTASRLDLCFSVGVCAMFQADPTELHFTVMKRIMKYVSGTYDFGLWFAYGTNPTLVGFSDADWTGSLDDKKSTSGGWFYLGNKLVTWYSKNRTPFQSQL
ncbi:secreted RxLR effector protein 161-like [Pistacia vera]|uniref:secreted RxLR effector protein 161-like n=1 Tax=Pistacia vera TaxID=55513 RepID=UPI001263A0EC|nr:secreted RxLR effector protein 161-like [Pistacia vera]